MPGPDFSHAVWRKSTRSSETGGNCVEVAIVGDLILIRDSKNPAQPAISLRRIFWRAFVSRIKVGSNSLGEVSCRGRNKHV